MVVCTCNPSYQRGRDRRIKSLRPALVELASPYLNQSVNRCKSWEGDLSGGVQGPAFSTSVLQKERKKGDCNGGENSCHLLLSQLW
jgi:hypothetical protein